MFAYCGNNPIKNEDPDGDIWETAFDVVTLCVSIAEVIVNPNDPWAWAIFTEYGFTKKASPDIIGTVGIYIGEQKRDA